MVEDCTTTNLQDDNLNEEGGRSVKLTETQDGLKRSSPPKHKKSKVHNKMDKPLKGQRGEESKMRI